IYEIQKEIETIENLIPLLLIFSLQRVKGRGNVENAVKLGWRRATGSSTAIAHLQGGRSEIGLREQERSALSQNGAVAVDVDRVQLRGLRVRPYTKADQIQRGLFSLDAHGKSPPPRSTDSENGGRPIS